MKEEQINIAIAEACGWVRGHTGATQWVNDPNGIRMGWSSMRDVADASLPDYCHDLNAMHEAERMLREDDQHACDCYLSDLFQDHGSDAISLPARQRAEAFLKTIGKWEEEA